MRLDLTGFAPDLDPETPGILADCSNIIPTSQKTLAAANTLEIVSVPPLDVNPTGGFIGRLLDGTKRIIVGTSDKLREISGTSYVDRSAAGGYTGTNRWEFAVFGNNILATNKSEAIQQAAPSADFAAIATAPKASIIDTAAGFVMALDFDDGTDTPDGWFCSGLYDQTLWTPSAATQCANGRLVDTPGRLTAGRALGNDFVAYKADSMYLGRYAGPPIIWTWQRVPGNIGCSAKKGVVVAENRHYFVGPSDFYVFDGTEPVAIGEPVREWFFSRLNKTSRDEIWGGVDEPRGLIYWHFPVENELLTECLVYNYRTNRWGVWDQQVQLPMQYSTGQITYDGLGAVYTTYSDLPNISYDSPFWVADSTVPAVFFERYLWQITGVPTVSWYQTGDFGDLTNFQMLSRMVPRYRLDPTSATGTNYYRDSLGATRTQDVTATQTRGRFDFRRSARWHSFRADHVGAMEVNGIDVQFKGNSKE